MSLTLSKQAGQRLAYLRRLLNHKRRVWQEGRKLNVPARLLLIHDWDKFVPWRFIAFAAAAEYLEAGQDKYKVEKLVPEFGKAWRSHVVNNKHHWEYYRDDGWSLKMPDVYRREMLADWRAMSKGDECLRKWYQNHPTLRLHPETRAWMDSQIEGVSGV